MLKPIKVVWDNQAKSDLKLIFDFFKIKSTQAAKNVTLDIVAQTKNIRFTGQYQTDEFLGEPFRRIIVSHYKIVYKVHSEKEIRIL